MVEPGHPPLSGRYELSSLLATGGMGQVWRGRDALLGRSVAIKVLRSEFTGDPTFLARFRAEAQHAAVLAHENIASVYDYGEVLPTAAGDAGAGEHLAFLVMELVEGESLSAVLERERRLDVARTLAVLGQTAAALAAAHAAGVVHRDVKPGNVLVRPDGRVKITDFGIAWSASSVPLTQTGQVVGTAHYLSPEQAEGAKAGPASDVYALGMIAYECLAGRRAFEGDNAVQIALRQIREVPEPLPADVPDAVRSLVGRMLLKDPTERFADGAAVRDAVDRLRADRPHRGDGGTRPIAVVWPTADTASTAVPSRPPRNRVLAPAIALVAGALVAVGAVSLLGAAEPPPVVEAAVDETETGSATVLLAAADYVGRPVDDVEAELAARGLRVERQAEPTGVVPAGEVLAVSPSGALQRGDLVTVTFAVEPAADETPGTRTEPDQVPVVVSEGAPAPEPVLPPAPAPGPAAGQPPGGGGSGAGPGGNGRGNGGDPPGGGNGGGNGNGQGRGRG